MFFSNGSFSTLSTTGSPYNMPRTVDGSESLSQNIHSAWLSRGYYPTSDFANQPTGYLTGPPKCGDITKETWEKQARAEFTRREQQTGKPLTNSQKIAIINAYRQCADIPPIGFNVDIEGAAILQDFEATTVSGVIRDSFKPVNVTSNLSQSFDGIVTGAKTIRDEIVQPLFGNVTLLAALGLGILIFAKRL